MRTIRTFEASIPNHQQAQDHLDQLGWAASKLWNVGRYYAQQQWDDSSSREATRLDRKRTERWMRSGGRYRPDPGDLTVGSEDELVNRRADL